METESFAILNDTGLTIRGEIQRPKPRGKFPVVVIAQDFFDTCESPHIKETARLLLERGIAVVPFDFTNGFGQSDGRGADTTISQRARDLELVAQYVKRRAYTNEKKLSILGFGLGAMAAFVLEGFQQTTQALVLSGCPASIYGTKWTSFSERELMLARLKRYFHVTVEGTPVRVNHTLLEDGERIDMARAARNLQTQVLFLAGSEDTIVPREEMEWLHDRVNCAKEIVDLPVPHIDSRKGVKAVIDAAEEFLKRQKVA